MINENRNPLYQIVLLLLSFYVLTALVLESFFISNVEIKKILQMIDFTICLVFLADFVFNLWSAKSKLSYLKWGWIDLLASVPALDPLRWGRLARVVRIFRFFRTIKSIKLLATSIHNSRIESLSILVIFISFSVYTTCAALILDYELNYGSTIKTASDALWWTFINILNAKVGMSEALSPEGAVLTVILNKTGLLLFAYLNGLIIAWLVSQRQIQGQNRDSLVGDE